MDNKNGVFFVLYFFCQGEGFELLKVFMGKGELVLSVCDGNNEELLFSSCHLFVEPGAGQMLW